MGSYNEISKLISKFGVSAIMDVIDQENEDLAGVESDLVLKKAANNLWWGDGDSFKNFLCDALGLGYCATHDQIIQKLKEKI